MCLRSRGCLETERVCARRSGRAARNTHYIGIAGTFYPTRLIMNAAQLVMNGQAYWRQFFREKPVRLRTLRTLWLLKGVAGWHSRRNLRMANTWPERSLTTQLARQGNIVCWIKPLVDSTFTRVRHSFLFFFFFFFLSSYVPVISSLFVCDYAKSVLIVGRWWHYDEISAVGM